MSAPAAALGRPLTDAQRLAWLRLIRTENVGPATFRSLVNRYGGAEAALDALPDLAARGGLKRRVRIASRDEVEAEIARAKAMGARFLCRGEPGFPEALAAADATPPVLAVMGDIAMFSRPGISIVGSRNSSAAGAKFARKLAEALGAEGLAIVSGLARGIDAAAHEASLATGTVGVFAGGLDRPYPEENKPLMRRIVDSGGCLVSEMPFGWTPRAVDFPRRNRIIAALSLGLIVVEAAMRSGSLISARFAGELGRLVFAVPGSPVDPRAAGTNRLLKDGAILVTEADDILSALRPMVRRGSIVPRHATLAEEDGEAPAAGEGPSAEGDERAAILSAIGPAPVSIDDLAGHTHASLGGLQLVLLELDLAGRLERHPGGLVSLSS